MKNTPSSVHFDFVDVEPDDPRLMNDVLPVLAELRPHLSEDSLRAIYTEGRPQGLRFTGAYRDGLCLGVAGWRIVASTHSYRKLTIDDLVTASSARSSGVGHALLAALRDKARVAHCHAIDLDSATHRTEAHRFYMRERLTIGAFHFAVDLPVDGTFDDDERNRG
jgi:GNAT superfamily N-acetyltransferase